MRFRALLRSLAQNRLILPSLAVGGKMQYLWHVFVCVRMHVWVFFEGKTVSPRGSLKSSQIFQGERCDVHHISMHEQVCISYI